MFNFSRISADQAKEKIDAGDVTIIDIRDESSFQAGHMTLAQHIDNQSLPRFLDATDPDIPLIVCCYHGNMSQSAAQFFAEQSFKEVYSLDGGFTLWQQCYPHLCSTSQD